MADTLQLEIVTPGAIIYSEAVDMVTLPGSEGETGIYPNHIPLMTKIQAGELIAKKAGSEEILAVSEGFAEITGDRVSILTDNAANSADIDESTVEEARTKAEKRLKEGDISEEEVKILNQAILYSAAQIRAKRRRG